MRAVEMPEEPADRSPKVYDFLSDEDSIFDEDSVFGDSPPPVTRVGLAELCTRLTALRPTLDFISGRRVIILHGRAGAGKTSLLYHIAKKKLTRVRHRQNCKTAFQKDVYVAEETMEGFSIGHDQVSETQALHHFERVPKGFGEDDPVVYLDTPGYEATSDPLVDLATSVAFRRVAEVCQSLRFVVLIHTGSFLERGNGIRDLVKLISSLVEDFCQHRFIFTFLFTHTDSLKEMVDTPVSKMREKLAGWVADTARGTSKEQEKEIMVLKWMKLCLQNSFPFVDVFHPEHSDVEKVISSMEMFDILEDGGHPTALGLKGGKKAKDVVCCRMTRAAESTLKLEVDQLLLKVWDSIENERLDTLAGLVRALKELEENVDTSTTQAAWADCEGRLKRKCDDLTNELHQQLLCGTDPKHSFDTATGQRALESMALLQAFAELDVPNLLPEDVGHRALHQLRTRLQLLASSVPKDLAEARQRCLDSVMIKLLKLQVWAEVHGEFVSLLRAGTDAVRDWMQEGIAWTCSTDEETVVSALARLDQVRIHTDGLRRLDVSTQGALDAFASASGRLKQLLADDASEAKAALDCLDTMEGEGLGMALEVEQLLNIFQERSARVERLSALSKASTLHELEQAAACEYQELLDKVTSLISSLFGASGKYEQKDSFLRTISRWSAYHVEDLQRTIFDDIDQLQDQVKSSLKSSDFREACEHPLKLLEQIASMEVPGIKQCAETTLNRLKNLIKRESDEVDQAVEKCIQTLEFARLPSLMPPPASKDEQMWQKFGSTLGEVDAALDTLDAHCMCYADDATSAAQAWRTMSRAKEDIGEYMKQHAGVDIAEKLHSITNAIEEHLGSLCIVAESLLAAEVTDFQQLREAQRAATLYYQTVRPALENDGKVWERLECLEKDAEDKVAEVDRMISSLIEVVQVRQRCDSRLYRILNLSKCQRIPEYSRWQQALREQLEDLHTKTKTGHCSQMNFQDIILLYRNLLQEWQGGLDEHVQGLSFSIQEELRQFEVMEDLWTGLRRGHWDPFDFYRQVLGGLHSDGMGEVAEDYRCQFRAEVDNLICDIEGSLIFRDIDTLRGLFQTAKSLNDPKLRKHLDTPWFQWARLTDTVLKCRSDFAQLCSSAAGQVSCGEYHSCSSSLKCLSEYLRQVAPLTTILTVQDVQTLCTEMHATFSSSVQQKLSELETACKAWGCSSIRSSIEDLRALAGLLTGDFAVYVQDVRDVLETGDLHQVNEMMSFMEMTFTSKRLWQLGRSFSILELPAEVCGRADIPGQKRKLAQKYHPDKLGQDGRKVMRRIDTAADHLCGCGQPDSVDHLVREYQQLLQDLFSEKVRGLPGLMLEEIRGLLERRLYDEVKKLSDALADFELVTELVRSPPMVAKETRCRVLSEIQRHVSHLAPGALKHCNEEKYSQLQRDLEALDSCIDNAFSSGHDAVYLDARSIRKELTQMLTAQIKVKAKSSWDTLNVPVTEEQIKRFAINLLGLGRIWSDLTEFRNEVRNHIDALLSFCLNSFQMGPPYLYKLGLVLSRGEGGSTVHQRAEEALAVGQQIINDFVQFKNLQPECEFLHALHDRILRGELLPPATTCARPSTLD